MSAEPAAPRASRGSQPTHDTQAGGGAISQAGERRSSKIESLRALAALAVFGGHIIGTTFAAGDAAPVGIGGLPLGERPCSTEAAWVSICSSA